MNDGYEAKVTSYAVKCRACIELYNAGVEHVRDRALVSDGLIHLYREPSTPICEARERATTGGTLTLTPEDARLLYDALGYWSSDNNDAPHDHIYAMRERLEKLGALR